jgi:hypothetical protein
MIWSAMPVQSTKCVPVFCFYASLPRASLLQGNATAGAKWQMLHFILTVAGCTTFVPKPDCNDSDFSSEVMESGTETAKDTELLISKLSVVSDITI